MNKSTQNKNDPLWHSSCVTVQWYMNTCRYVTRNMSLFAKEPYKSAMVSSYSFRNPARTRAVYLDESIFVHDLFSFVYRDSFKCVQWPTHMKRFKKKWVKVHLWENHGTLRGWLENTEASEFLQQHTRSLSRTNIFILCITHSLICWHGCFCVF